MVNFHFVWLIAFLYSAWKGRRRFEENNVGGFQADKKKILEAKREKSMCKWAIEKPYRGVKLGHNGHIWWIYL